MKSKMLITRSLLASVMIFLAIGLFAQDKEKTTGYVPHVGQAGKDVIWVPTPENLVKKMLEIAKVTPQDYVVDLGSGDGRTVIAAAKLNAKATGIEYNPDMVEFATKNAKEAGVSDRANFIKADLFEYDLSNATVITMFLLPEINLKLRPKLLDLKPGTRIVSNTFTMGEWDPDLEVTIDENMSWNTALLWIVPAKVEGTWKMGDSEMTLNQEFQKFWGNNKQGNKTTPISEGKLDGANISFKIGSAAYTGKVNGKTMSGTATTGSSKFDWTATKTN
ncbi:MAG TPA: class I SAM-dependent methyltransferase [Bacteroidales bacterium]|nr:class I SAM-dependent methyltransferase [Bacteroidales bacterium]